VDEEDPKESAIGRIGQRRWEAAELPATGIWAERRRLAGALRQVIEHLISTDTPEAELATAADRLEEYATHLEKHPRRPYLGFSESALAEGGGHFDYSPLIGRSNPLAPPIRIRAEQGRGVGEVVFGSAYEGPPGCVHGGYVAAAFDEVLGFAQALGGAPGMTGTLTIRYRRPTPLHTLLRFTCWVDRVEGRKNFAKGTLHAGEELCAESDAIFVRVDTSKFQTLVEQRRKQSEES
jgi:acyl-coenzyme A thioesterase PaaI-like protein